MKKVMVFGVFDGLHDGHREFLRSARREGDFLVAVVTPDHIVYDLKGYLPEQHAGDRAEHLHREGLADQVVMGDGEMSSWHVVRAHRPDVVALGYDQHELGRELELFLAGLGWQTEFRVMPAHRPEVFQSRLLKKAKVRKY